MTTTPPPPSWPPHRERPSITSALRAALDRYQTATATFELAAALSFWAAVKVWWQQWRAERAAYDALKADHAATRYVFMTAFDHDMWMRNGASRGEVLDYAVKLFEEAS